MAVPNEPRPPVDGLPRADAPGRWLLRNEFSAVAVELDLAANSPRLKITDLRTGRAGYLDPLELERLSVARHTDLAWIVSPATGDPVDAAQSS